jgi:RNA 2',3'-cyclic 3'-phosphodiesterase
MTAERPGSPRARYFVALELPGSYLGRLSAWQQQVVAVDSALRPAAPPIHITLAFLGWQRERDADAIAEAAFSIEAKAPLLLPLPAVVPVPPRGRPRLFAVEFESEEAKALQSDISDGLESARFYRPEKRPFWPHATVARVRAERGARNKPRLVESPPSALPEELLTPFRAVRVRLYRSVLRPQGAEYTPMAGIELPLAAADS